MGTLFGTVLTEMKGDSSISKVCCNGENGGSEKG